MPRAIHGHLIPIGGGDTIPLIRQVLTLGRRESCDVCLRFPNISGRHCELSFVEGYWYIRDLNSTNGIKVNGVRIREKMLHPNDELTIAKRSYTIAYELPADRRALDEALPEDIGQSLLEKAGLVHRGRGRRKGDGQLLPSDLAEIDYEDDEDEGKK